MGVWRPLIKKNPRNPGKRLGLASFTCGGVVPGLLPQLFQEKLVSFDFPGSSDGKESACNAGDPGWIPRWGRSSGKGMATHSSILAQRIPWTEKPGGLQSTGSQSWIQWSNQYFHFT